MISTMTTIDNRSAVQQSALLAQDILLDVKDLTVTFGTPDGDVTAVNALNFDLRAG